MAMRLCDDGVNIVAALRSSLARAGTPAQAASAAAYFKKVCKFYGVKSAGVQAVHAAATSALARTSRAGEVALAVSRPCRDDEHPLGHRPGTGEVALAVSRACLDDEYHEMKQCGILTMFKYKSLLHNMPGGPTACVDVVDAAFDCGSVYDWATTDMLSSRVLAEAIRKDRGLADRVASWRAAQDQWKRRASAVTFVKLTKPSDGFRELILTVAADVVRGPERFVQLGCGWLIREFGVHYEDDAVRFIEDNIQFLSAEGLRYAVEKMPAAIRSRLLGHAGRQGKRGVVVASDAALKTLTVAEAVAVALPEKRRAASPTELLRDEPAPTVPRRRARVAMK